MRAFQETSLVNNTRMNYMQLIKMVENRSEEFGVTFTVERHASNDWRIMLQRHGRLSCIARCKSCTSLYWYFIDVTDTMRDVRYAEQEMIDEQRAHARQHAQRVANEALAQEEKTKSKRVSKK